MPSGSQDIFLSYRRDDAGVSASLLQMCLEQCLPGTQVFRDAKSIEPGVNFRTRIEDAIRSSAVLLALIGPHWLAAADDTGRRRLDDPDDVLVWEITLALRLGVRVIPVLVEGARMPPAEQLPPVLREVAELQAVTLDHQNLDLYLVAVRYMAPAIERAQAESARIRQAREQLPGVNQVLDNQTPIPEFAAQIQRIRVGDARHPPSPANTMATLRIFAQQRPIADLLQLWPATEESGGFAPLDAVAIFTLAVVDRSAAEAAALAVGLRRVELQGSGLTESIIHDLAAQRTVPGVAEFIAECKRHGQADLVRETLTAFATSASRLSMDKALLYFELLRFHCDVEAEALLAETLSMEGAAAPAAGRGEHPRPLAGVIGEVGIVGALRHLSPSQQIVEEWINERMRSPANWQKTASLVANLLGNEPNGDRLLAEYIGRAWAPTPLIRLCEVLAASADSEPPGLRLVRRYVAARDCEPLADVIGQWYQSQSAKLAGGFAALLAEIVTGGEDSAEPRPIDFIDNLAAALEKPGTPPKCRSELFVAAATHARRRPGADVAEMLGRVGRADRRRTAHKINAWFARGLAAHEVASGQYVEYLNKLRTLADASTLIFWAVRELTDPATADRCLLRGEQIGDIAVSIYADGLQDTGFDLLERYLENEQAVTAKDAADIVARVNDSAGMRDDPRWEALLGATIGRWADTSRLEEMRDEFRGKGHLREAEAVMSLFQ